MMYANIDDGYPEALCRALRKGFLLDHHYAQLKQTSNIAEFKLVLEDTDYGSNIFAGQENEFEVQLLRKNMKEKLMEEIQHMLAHAVYPLNRFLEMMLHKYQIENVVFIIEGLKGNRSIEELMRTADPLGRFPELKNV
jgi:V-type H+-transporting ATPase subunit d